MKQLTGLLLLSLLWSGAAVAAPPPPPPPDALDNIPVEIDGYAPRPFYGAFVYWIEQNKGLAVEKAFEETSDIAGRKPTEFPLISFKKFNDYGYFLYGEIRSFCSPATRNQLDLEDCQLILRRGFIKEDALGYNENEVSKWTKKNFNPYLLVETLKKLGFDRATKWYEPSKDGLFSKMKSPIPFLKSRITTVQYNLEQCPQAIVALKRLESKRLNIPLDFPMIGTDRKVKYPWPHSIVNEVSITVLSKIGKFQVTGKLNALSKTVAPILDAVDKCEDGLGDTIVTVPPNPS